jgi:uncharacterized protein (TIGR03437 family)
MREVLLRSGASSGNASLAARTHPRASSNGPTPGTPSAIGSAAFIVTGGMGPYEGARGYFNKPGGSNVPIRVISAAEDPSYRRVNGGGTIHPNLYLIPSRWPEILTVNGAPMVYHSDFTPVTTDKPAGAGEVLIARVKGMGPTRPGVDPGQPFPDPPVPVNSPVGVTVNGHDSDVINAVAWPGTTDQYRVDFRIPLGLCVRGRRHTDQRSMDCWDAFEHSGSLRGFRSPPRRARSLLKLLCPSAQFPSHVNGDEQVKARMGLRAYYGPPGQNPVVEAW